MTGRRIDRLRPALAEPGSVPGRFRATLGRLLRVLGGWLGRPRQALGGWLGRPLRALGRLVGPRLRRLERPLDVAMYRIEHPLAWVLRRAGHPLAWLAARTERRTARLRRWVATHRPHQHQLTVAAGRFVAILGIAAAGAVIGVLLAGSVVTDLGPFHARLQLVPSLSGGTEVSIPPLGSLYLDSHLGPLHLRIQLEALDEARARALVNDPNGIESVSASAVDDLDRGIRALAMRVTGASVLGAMALAALVFRTARRVAATGGMAIALVAASGGIASATFRPDAIQEPRYRGLLTNAPAVVGDARRIADQYKEYRAQLQRMVQNVSKLYGTISTLPVYEPEADTTRVLHISDMHLNPAAWSVVATVVKQFNVDVVVDTGDITDWGSEPEKSYLDGIGNLKVPYLYIRGNHDSVNIAAAVAAQPNATVLDSSVVTVSGLTFAGIGDPRFTPDKTDKANGDHGPDRELVRMTGASLAGRIRVSEVAVDVAMVHDPVAAETLAFACPVVLAGHVHKREVRRLDGPAGSPTDHRTLLMVEGSTGGAGLRGLEQRDPLSLSLSVLYFDKYRALQAYDDILVGGTGLSQVSLERHLVPRDEKATPTPKESASADSSPSVSPSDAVPAGSAGAAPAGSAGVVPLQPGAVPTSAGRPPG